MTNHLPGRAYLTRDDLLDSELKDFKKNQELFDCFLSPQSFYSNTLRLFNKNECQTFFETSKKKKFLKMMRTKTLYTIKNMNSEKEYSLDYMELQRLNTKFQGGNLCGKIEDKLILREYIWNQLKYKNGHKFKIRSFMIVTSTDPMMVVFSPGYAILDRFNNTISFSEASITLESLFEFIKEDQKISSKQVNDIMNKIKQISTLLHIIFKSKYYRDSRFYQVFAIDFIIDNKLQPWLIDIKGAPDYMDKNQEFIHNLMKLMNEINQERSNKMMKKIISFKYEINSMIFENKLETKYWSKFIPFMREKISTSFVDFNNNSSNILPSTKRVNDLGFEVLHVEKKTSESFNKNIVPEYCINHIERTY